MKFLAFVLTSLILALPAFASPRDCSRDMRKALLGWLTDDKAYFFDNIQVGEISVPSRGALLLGYFADMVQVAKPGRVDKMMGIVRFDPATCKMINPTPDNVVESATMGMQAPTEYIRVMGKTLNGLESAK